MAKVSRKEIKHDEFVDTTWKYLHQIEENPRPYIIGVGAIVLAAVAAAGFWTMSASRARDAAEKLSLGLAALNGPVVAEGASIEDPYRPQYTSVEQRGEVAIERLSTASRSGGTAGKVSLYLEGIAQLKAGQAEQAVATLEEASRELSGDPTFATAAKAAYARALEAADRHAEALTIYQQLGEQESSGLPKDMVLMGLARTREATGDIDGAKAAYREVVDMATLLSTRARDELARLDG